MLSYPYRLFHAFVGCALVLLFSSTSFGIAIKSKAEWGGVTASDGLSKLNLPVHRVIISHTATSDCNSEIACAEILNSIQSFHMNNAKFSDIAYNFLIGNDGNVYEGRGWDWQGAFARGYNADSLGVAFIGTFLKQVPSEAALSAAKELLADAVRLGKLTDDYKLFGTRQVASTESPGAMLYSLIREWPHWSSTA